MKIKYEDDYEEFDYEIDFDELEYAMIDIVGDYYGLDRDTAKRIYNDFNDAMNEFFEEDIKSYFEEEAWQNHKESEEEDKYWRTHDIHGGV